MLCNISDRIYLSTVFYNDAWFIVFMIFFSLSNGYFVSLPMCLAPTWVEQLTWLCLDWVLFYNVVIQSFNAMQVIFFIIDQFFYFFRTPQILWYTVYTCVIYLYINGSNYRQLCHLHALSMSRFDHPIVCLHKESGVIFVCMAAA